MTATTGGVLYSAGAEPEFGGYVRRRWAIALRGLQGALNVPWMTLFLRVARIENQKGAMSATTYDPASGRARPPWFKLAGVFSLKWQPTYVQSGGAGRHFLNTTPVRPITTWAISRADAVRRRTSSAISVYLRLIRRFARPGHAALLPDGDRDGQSNQSLAAGPMQSWRRCCASELRFLVGRAGHLNQQRATGPILTANKQFGDVDVRLMRYRTFDSVEPPSARPA